MKLYLAGPLGFSEAGRMFQDEVLIPLLNGLGFEVFNPWTPADPAAIDAAIAMDYGPAKRDAWRALNGVIGANNTAAIDGCDAVVAVLDGVDVDSGTAAEIGYAFARGKRIWGYRGDFRLSADNDGAEINLQVEYFIRQSGGGIYHSVAELTDAIRH